MFSSGQTERMIVLRGIAAVHDFLISTAAFYLALLLRLGPEEVLVNWVPYALASLFFGLIVVAVGFAFGMNRGVWRYASLSDLVAIIKTVTASIALFVVFYFLLVRLQPIPRSCVLIAWAFTIVLLSSSRAAYRLYKNHREARRRQSGEYRAPKRVFVVGANNNADLFLRAISEGHELHYDVLAIIDERGRRTGRLIRGVPVAGTPEDLPKLVAQFEEQDRRPEAIVLARTRLEYQQYAKLERLIEIAGDQQLEVLCLPNLLEVRPIDADFDIRPIRLEDLLQRPSSGYNSNHVADIIKDQKLLITGAGGSIGSELVRQLVTLSPRSVVLVDASEYLLYSIESELLRKKVTIPLVARLCNVREKDSIKRLIASEAPDIVFHAAALKHVPIVETQPLEGILTNTIGTRNLAEACRAANVKAMILISTDKAVNPTNVMGASKRMAEMFCQALDVHPDSCRTRFVTVRFGNVLGSAGSVVPLFEKQIKAGGPLTVTHPEIERYFMTIPESCMLILQATAYGLRRKDERGHIFVLNMGTPVKIVDMARNLIRLSGLRPDIDIKIVYTGLRPGEKLYEELFDAREELVETGVTDILAASPRAVEQQMIFRIFDEMERLIATNDARSALRLLRTTVADFTPSPVIEAILSNQGSSSPGTGADTAT